MEIRGTKTLLCGGPGTGKTYSLTTFIEAGLDLAVVVTDPGGDESLLASMKERKLPLEKLHMKYLPVATQSWEVLKAVSGRINIMGYKDLSEMKHGLEKQAHRQFIELLETLSNFVDDRTGEKLGAIDTWGPDIALSIDSFSGVNKMALDLMVGGKPAPHMGEWGVAMNIEERLLDKLCSDTKCFFVATAHVETEFDEVAGRRFLMPAFLGSKLAPKVPRIFSDVVMAYKEGDKFYWTTTESNAFLKARNLPLSSKLAPSFAQIVDNRKKQYLEEEHIEELKNNKPSEVSQSSPSPQPKSPN